MKNRDEIAKRNKRLYNKSKLQEEEKVKKQEICGIDGLQIRTGKTIKIADIKVRINKGERIAIISQEDEATTLLQMIAGFREKEEGEITYPLWTLSKKTPLTTYLQYVPDDIICYTNMTVKQFLSGVHKAGKAEEVWEESLRLCEKFSIALEEQLLNLTFEQNRLVAMIMALTADTEMLLLDRPYDLLSGKMYDLFLEELERINKKGATILLSATSYEQVKVSCDRYIFLREGKPVQEYSREEIPFPAKVITLFGGNVAGMEKEKLQMLWQKAEQSVFLYKEKDMQELAVRLSKTGCRNFRVEDLTVEEEIFGDYERYGQ